MTADLTPPELNNVETRLYIGGNFRDGEKGVAFPNIDPSTEEAIGTTADGTVADMDAAIAAARKAFDQTDWSTNHAFRLECLKQLYAGLLEEKELIREITIAETGAPNFATQAAFVDFPIDMLQYMIDFLPTYEWENSIGMQEFMGLKTERIRRKEAIGVVGCITPWNVPLQINLAKCVPALAAGCTIVLKPAPDTPWTATHLAHVIDKYTDIPAGVFNVVPSADPVTTGELLTTDPRVDMVSFTGSTATGRHIMALASETVKKVFLELGGKSANIYLDDADLASTLPMASTVCFHAGQGCAIATRLLIPRDKYEESLEMLKMIFEFMPYGEPHSDDQIMGPLINKRQYERVTGYIKQGIEEGARLITGGVERPDNLDKGYYVRPTLLADVTNDMTVAQEEIFGPVLVAIPFDDDDDAVRIANDTIFGLSGSVWSADEARARRVAERLRTGTVNINGGNFFGPDSPFGGYKQSGIGREMGREGFEEYLETKLMAFGRN